MTLFQKKHKITSEEFGKRLSDYYTKFIIEDFDEEELSWIHSSFNNSSKSTLLREWIFFNMFLMFQGVSAYFKESEKGYQILDNFHLFCGDTFVQLDIFKKKSDFIMLLMSRYDSYSNSLKETRPPNPLYWLSKKFCFLCGDDSNISALMATSDYYLQVAIDNRNLISNLMKDFQIID